MAPCWVSFELAMTGTQSGSSPCRRATKELVLRNFSGVSGDQLVERMIELSLYAEDKL
jgi:hypothetical protein